ncbi:MAG: hypothetical protein HC880_22170 [Bacteroidia bacterium]|nr:hypothetical protein [Bacteroidia bacterium]
MKNKIEHKNVILKKFKERNKPYENWQTYNNQINTVLFDKENREIKRKDIINLAKDEFPLLECSLPNDNYFLMTTEKVYSYFMHYLQQGDYHTLEGFHPSTYFFKHPSLGNNTELYALQYQNKSLLFYEIDSGDPGYCAQDFFRIILGRTGITISLKNQ